MGSHDIFPALSGAVANWREVEVLASNLSNVTSTGFKEHLLSFELQDRGDLPLQSSYVKVNAAGADMSDGPIQQTGVATHIALRGEGFLVAEAEDGEQVLTRSGALQIDNQGFLVTHRGERVLGEGGYLQVPLQETVEFAADGTVTSRRGDGTDFFVTNIGKLQLVTADEVEPLGGSRWRAVDGVQPAQNLRVQQGALEGSNVDAIGGMVQLIQASRHFDMAQRAMQTSDQLDGRIYQVLRS